MWVAAVGSGCSDGGGGELGLDPVRTHPVSASDLDPGLRAAYVRAVQKHAPADYAFAPAGAASHSNRRAFVSKNAAEELVAEASLKGLKIAPTDGAGWWVGLRLGAVGRGERLAPVAPQQRSLVAAANRASWEHEGGIEEWYVSGPLGLEQGFVLGEPPVGSAGDVVLAVEIEGDLDPSLGEGGEWVELRDESGARRLRYTDLFAWDADGDALPAAMAVEGDRILLRLDDTLASYPIHIDPLVWAEEAKLVASDGETGDRFGRSVSVSGDTAVVGAHLDDFPEGTGQGSAYVFVRSGLTWSEQQKLVASDGTYDDFFGWSVSVSGDTVVVGAWGDDGLVGDYRGAAYVFVRSGVTWTEQQKLVANDGADGDRFGAAVAVSGDTAVVGAHFSDGPDGPDQGSAYVFVRSGSVWSEQQKLVVNDGATDVFGYSVSLSGDTAVVGTAPGTNGCSPADCKGSAYVFVRSGVTWSEQQKLVGSGNNAVDSFGASVSMSGETVIVGAHGEDGLGGDNQGSAYVFVRDGVTWSEQQKLVASDCAAGDSFGASVSVSGDTAVVGAYAKEGPAGDYQGSAYVFVRSGITWSEEQKLVASDGAAFDSFGLSVSVSGDIAVVGAYEDDGPTGPKQGSAYVFRPGANGAPCLNANDCISGFCVDGVCCNDACGGGSTSDCLACSIAAGGPVDGTCGPLADGLGCDDGLYCTVADTCSSGSCLGAGDPCAANTGDADSDCSESCNEAAGDCTGDDPDGASCDDGLYCTQTDTCAMGVCAGIGDPCAANTGDADADCSESCNETADDCTGDDPDGASCDDGLYCTQTDTCAMGVCAGIGDPCAANTGDADADCSESCNETTDDCTSDDADGAACDDAVACNGVDSCALGACTTHADECQGGGGMAGAGGAGGGPVGVGGSGSGASNGGGVPDEYGGQASEILVAGGGGCGCRTAPRPGSWQLLWLAVVATAVLGRRCSPRRAAAVEGAPRARPETRCLTTRGR